MSDARDAFQRVIEQQDDAARKILGLPPGAALAADPLDRANARPDSDDNGDGDTEDRANAHPLADHGERP